MLIFFFILTRTHIRCGFMLNLHNQIYKHNSNSIKFQSQTRHKAYNMKTNSWNLRQGNWSSLHLMSCDHENSNWAYFLKYIMRYLELAMEYLLWFEGCMYRNFLFLSKRILMKCICKIPLSILIMTILICKSYTFIQQSASYIYVTYIIQCFN